MRIWKLYKLVVGVGIVSFRDSKELFSKQTWLKELDTFLLLKHIMTPEERCYDLDRYKEITILHKNKICFRQLNPEQFKQWFEELE